MGIFLHSLYVVWVLLGLNHLSTLTHSLNAHNSKIKEFPWPNLPESVSECDFKGMLMWNSLKWNPLHSEALSQDVLCDYKWLGLCKCSRHPDLPSITPACNTWVSLWAALTVIRTAKNCPGGDGEENSTVAWEVLRSEGGEPTGTFTEHLLEVRNWTQWTEVLRHMTSSSYNSLEGNMSLTIPTLQTRRPRYIKMRHLAGGGVRVRIQQSHQIMHGPAWKVGSKCRERNLRALGPAA